MSEVLGSVLLTVTAVVLLGGFGLVVFSSVDSTHAPPTGAFALDAEDGDTAVDLRFVSGSSFPLDGLRILLVVDGADRVASYGVDAPATPGRFSPGDRLVIQIAGDPLVDGQQARAMLVDTASGKAVGTTATTVLGPASLPAYVANAPTIASVEMVPARLVADGRTLGDLQVAVGATWGLGLVERVTVDLTPIGGPVDARLRDDGQGGDALASDGIYTLQLSAAPRSFVVVPSVETVALRVEAHDILGKTASRTALLALEAPPQSKVTPGAKWRDLPRSDEVRYVNLTNVTLRDAQKLGTDQIQIRVSDLHDSSVAWTALVTFGDAAGCGGEGGIASVELTRDGVAGSLTYAPTVGCLTLGSLTHLNVADVPASLDAGGATLAWSASGAPGPYLYSAAGLSSTNEATVTFLGDAASPSPGERGLAQADLVWARVAGTSPAAAFSSATSGLTLDVDASASTDPQGDALTFAWDWGDGATSGPSASPLASHAYAVAGQYPVMLTVRDPGGLAGSTTSILTINREPVASFTHTVSDLTLDVTSASTDPDGHALTHAWEWGDGSTGTGATATHAYASGGAYDVNLTVTDPLGGTSRTSERVTISGLNVVPTATLASNVTAGLAPLDVTLTLDGSDSDGTITGWTLSYGDGTSASGTTLPTTRAKTYASLGSYQANLTVTDSRGGVAGASVNLTVSTNQAPSANIVANRTTGHAPLDVQLTLSGSDADGSIASWSLSWGDGGVSTGVGLPTARTHRYAAGDFLAELTVTDDRGASRTVGLPLAVNARPTAALSITGTSGLEVSASAAGSSDADGVVTWYEWDWGDGTMSNTSAPSATHTYPAVGQYSVNLTVVDDEGAASLAPATVTATLAMPPGAPGSLAALGANATVALSWSPPSSDGGSPVTSYHIYVGTTSGQASWLASIGTNTSFTVNGLTNGQGYVFNVTAENAVGQGASSGGVSATPAALPYPPASLVATGNVGQVSLSWTAGDTGGSPITAYQVHRGTGGGALALLATVGANLTYSDLAVVSGTTYTYHVRAVTSMGTSNPSVTRSAVPTATAQIDCNSGVITSGTISSCSDLQFADLAYATFEESGGTPPRLFQATYTLNVGALEGAKTLEFNGYRGNAPEDLLVQAWNATSGAWETKISMPASTTSPQAFAATVFSQHHFSNGVFTIRLIDPNTATGTGTDSNFSTWLVDYVRLVNA